MKIKTGDVMDLWNGVEVLAARRFATVQSSYRFSRLRGQVAQVMKVVNERRDDIRARLMQPDSDPKKQGNYVPKDGKQAEVDSEWKRLREEDLEIDLHRMDLQDLEGMTVILHAWEEGSVVDKVLPAPPEAWILDLMDRCGCLKAAE